MRLDRGLGRYIYNDFMREDTTAEKVAGARGPGSRGQADVHVHVCVHVCAAGVGCVFVCLVCACVTLACLCSHRTRVGREARVGPLTKGFVERRVKSWSCHQLALGSGEKPSVKSLVVTPKYLLLEEERREGLTGGTGVGSGLKGP